MINSIFNYLLESSLCLLVFMLAYRIFITNSMYFSWMRFYLLVSAVLSLILPLIVIPIEWSVRLIPTDSFANAFLTQTEQTTANSINSEPKLTQVSSETSVFKMILFFALIVYGIGVIYKFYLFAKNLIKINGLIKKSSKVKEGKYWIINFKSEMPAFSFFNHIFINNTYKNLSSNELQVIKQHEIVHVKQYHTLDILFVELFSVLFWFNPIVNYLKKSLKEIHEYIVDERIAGHGENKRAYAQLLLTLASDTKVFNLATSFAGDHVKRRILMMGKPKTSSIYKLMFLILVPLTAFFLVSFSCLKNPEMDSIQNKVSGIQVDLKKYCGVYFPSKEYAYLKPMEIKLRDNKLFIDAGPGSTNRTIELHFEADKWDWESVFSYTDSSARSLAFDLDSKKEVSGFVVVKFTTRGQSDYLVKEGEYSKREPGK